MESSFQGMVLGNSREANASEHMRGWIAGHMHEGSQGSKEFEVKLWHYDEPFDYGVKSFGGTELVVIYGGQLRFEFEDERGNHKIVYLEGKSHQYLIIPPNLKKRVVVEVAPAFGTTVRWPSGPGVNQVLSK